MMTSPHICDDFKLTIVVLQGGSPKDISATTERKIFIERPGYPTLLIKSADFVTDGRDGKMWCQISTIENDVVGTWRVSGRLVWADGTMRSTRGGWFRVLSNLWACGYAFMAAQAVDIVPRSPRIIAG